MKLKKMAAVLLAALCLLLGCAQTAFAEETQTYSVGGVDPLHEIAKKATSDLTINSTVAYCKSYAQGDYVVSITVEQTLQKYSGWLWIWNDYRNAAWTSTVSSSSISLSNTKTGLPSGKYRVKSVFTLTNSSGRSETITVYSDEKRVG